MTEQEIDRIECAIRHIESSTDVDPWACKIAVDAMKRLIETHEHGRLIDADALKEVIAANVYPVSDDFNSRDYGMFWTGGIEKAIDEQPTIELERDFFTVTNTLSEEEFKKALEKANEEAIILAAEPGRKRGKCAWCSSPYRIEYYWIDRDGNTASFQDKERHLVATGIANFCPNCGSDMRGERE